jgi:hypothetical protein
MVSPMDTQTPHVTLCVIAGREAIHIERMLRSFAPVFDTLSLTIANGSQQPDDTHDIAANVCRELGKGFIRSFYDNHPSAKNWPHVDDFAAARNKSFDAHRGQCDWLFWADCDDVFAGDAEAFRELTRGAKNVAWSFPYEIPSAGKVAVRERLISWDTLQAGAAWVGPVHENLAMPDVTLRMTCEDCRWVHRPLEGKDKDPKRNLRILTRAVADSPTYFFYIAQEYAAARNKPNLRRFGEIFLSMPGGEPSMRYQMHLYLAEAADTHTERAHHALMAYWTFPYAEALAALTKFAMEENDAQKALHFSQMLIDTPVPKPTQWFHEPRWYGWAGEDLHVRALRMNGRGKDAHDFWLNCFNCDPVAAVYTLPDDDAGAAMRVREVWMNRATEPRRVDWFFRLPKDSPARKWLTGFQLLASDVPTAGMIEVRDELPQEGWDE